MSVVAVLLVALLAPALPAKLPPYMKPCRRSDPNLEACLFKHGTEALPYMIQGDPKYDIPKLDPLIIEEIVVGGGKVGSRGMGITFSCEKCRLIGLKDVKVRALRLDPKKQHIELETTVPKLEIKGKYKASGKVLVLPINGDGIAELTLTSLEVLYKSDYDIKKGKDSKDHIWLKNPKIEFKADGFNIELTNLFKRDHNLGKHMNVFLNQNWREMLAEFGPEVGEAVGKIVTLIVNNISQKVAYDDLFPE